MLIQRRFDDAHPTMTGAAHVNVEMGTIEPSDESQSSSLRHGILEVGRNCQSIAHADRFALLIDGSAYFSVLREALARAERTIFIVGWDIDSRMQLVPDGAGDRLPAALGDFLQTLSSRRRRCGFRRS